ncbi:MAG: Bifunctional protein GlmU [Bacteroidetes bacterium ADurb.Bin217]|nr:MAG: Bifunctional protein GlmU [Bacteroidetes bacterium ADurb.Bin217]
MNVVLFDSYRRNDLKPLTYTRPVAEIRCGILTIKEKWDVVLHTTCSYLTEPYLQNKYPMIEAAETLYINAACLPTATLVEEVLQLQSGEALCCNDELIAVNTKNTFIEQPEAYTCSETLSDLRKIQYPWDIFTLNSFEIDSDFALLTKHKTSQKISSTNNIIAPENIFIEPDAIVEFATINASKGKVYIGKYAEIMEGAVVRGPFALCNNATVKMAAKIYEGTTIGPYCKVGGEVQNSVFFGYSNKGHDGYLGNSVLGEWCNLGADTNNSNLKNDYSDVKVWNYTSERFMKTGLQFCGLIMGDHSKSAINTMFNTGTVVGVSSNVFGSGFPRNFFPSFSWGGAEGMSEYALKKACDTAQRVYSRRSKVFDQIEIDIFSHIFEETKKYRRY